MDYDSHLLLLGSCFSENMGRKLDYFKFQAVQNPLGILFHPKAIENLVERAINKKLYSAEDIFDHRGIWQSFDTHTVLNNSSKRGLIENLNTVLETTLGQLKKSSHIIITLGTAWVYRHKVTGNIVANCHKVPQTAFLKELLSVHELVESLRRTIESILSVNPKVKFIFTISPVRHLKDGFVENQRSKAHLIAAVHEILNSVDFASLVSYFPSYEIQMDELRDYRFYERDMVHPNQMAIDYIWEKFKKVWISEEVYMLMDEVNSVQNGLRHRPFRPDSEEYQTFKETLDHKIKNLQKRYPFIAFKPTLKS